MMKHRLCPWFPWLLALLFFSACSDDPCTIVPNSGHHTLPNCSIEVKTQEDLELLRGIVTIDGSLTIAGSADSNAVFDLTPLESLEIVTGILKISG